MSLFVKEKLFIGEATVATIAGLILGPHCLNWFNPLLWGNTDHTTLEISRIVLCIQIVAVAVELPRKYMKKHWLSVGLLLLPVMTCGWLVVGLFIWLLIPHFNFADGLLVSACVTATDPVLAAAVVGKGKFAERVPGHLRNLLTAESGCNDGMAFPFIYLSLNIVLHPGNARVIVRDWFTLTILWECLFGIVLGVVLGYALRKAVAFAETRDLIDRESFLALFIFLAFVSAGLGSILGVDDLLVSFASGTAFGWNGSFAKKTEESRISTVIDLLLNLAFFVYFGAIVPWPDFNNSGLGLDVWRLIVLAIVIIFLRRIPAVLALKPFIPDVKTWREALFCGHFGPIGVGAIFAAILARTDLEKHYSLEEAPLATIPLLISHYQLIESIWPIVCFIVITSIVVHGSSVAVLLLGRRLNRMTLTMSFTTTNTQEHGPSWMSRLQKLDKTSSSFSLHRIDSVVPDTDLGLRTPTIETSGVKIRPAGGAKRKKQRRGFRLGKAKLAELGSDPTTERQRPQAEFLQLGRRDADQSTLAGAREKEELSDSFDSHTRKQEEEEVPYKHQHHAGGLFHDPEKDIPDSERELEQLDNERNVYEEGDQIVVENQDGEIVNTFPLRQAEKDGLPLDASIHSMASLQRHLHEFSVDGHKPLGEPLEIVQSLQQPGKRALVRKGASAQRFFAFQIDNVIVVENADGEIVRRYRVNKHPGKRARSNTILDRAKAFVGLNRRPSQVPNIANHPEAVGDRVPVGTKEEIGAVGVENRLAEILQTAEAQSDEAVDADEAYDLGLETEVERRRRLAALGQIADRRDEEDEEE